MLKALRYDAEMFSQFQDLPPGSAKEDSFEIRGMEGMDFHAERLDQRRLSRPIGADDRDVLVLLDGQGDVIQNPLTEALDGSVSKFNEGVHEASIARLGVRGSAPFLRIVIEDFILQGGERDHHQGDRKIRLSIFQRFTEVSIVFRPFVQLTGAEAD